MIVFAAFTPHSPLLLPVIGKEHRKRLKHTLAAMKTLAEHLYAARPETMVILSSHSTMHETAFSMNLHDEYVTDLSRFGDLGTKQEFEPDLALMDGIQRSLRRAEQPMTLDSDAALDHGTAVPLLLLTERLPNIRIVPISYSGLDAKAHVAFGRALREALETSPRRLAVIASGDLSHALSSKAPAGFHKEGKWFDDLAQEALVNSSLSKILAADSEKIKAATECAYRPLLMFLGILEEKHGQSEILSYEAPFGVGLLVVQYHLL
jgi:AmmeMemoRadiSam system protein B